MPSATRPSSTSASIAHSGSHSATLGRLAARAARPKRRARSRRSAACSGP